MIFTMTLIIGEENQYESAPETRNLVEGRPAVGVQTYSNTGEVMEDNAFYRYLVR